MIGPYGDARHPAGRLRRVLVRPPQAPAAAHWQAYGWRTAPDPVRLAEEHAAFRAELERSGSEVVVGTTPALHDPDAVYVRDPALVCARGAILLRPGKEGRRGEPTAVAEDLAAAMVPIVGRLEPPATAEGGDALWLDEHTLLVGRGYRTNDAGIAALRALLPEVEVIAFDLPHLRGPGEVLHLMSLISMLDRDLALVHAPPAPVRLLELLRERGVATVEVPGKEFDSMGPNVLALAPRVVLAVDGNPETRRRMEAAGVEVRTYAGQEISRKGDGGPTCLTLPLVRD